MSVFTEEQLIEAIKSSISIRQTIKKLGLVPAGGNYATIKKLIKKLNLDTSHFLGQRHLKGKTHNWSKLIPLDKVLVKYSNYNSHRLKLRLIKNNILKDECSRCKISTWEGEKLSLHLDHINGIKTDHRLKNLQLLCPNCHSLTSTYCGKNKKKQPKLQKRPKLKKQKVIKEPKQKNKCVDCGFKISQKATRCKSCKAKLQQTKISWPLIEELKMRLSNSNYSQLAKELGISDNAIRKRIKNHS